MQYVIRHYTWGVVEIIKTIISKDIIDLDKQVNDFMTARRQNLPVRTEVVVRTFPSVVEVEHKATIFYDEKFGQATPEASAPAASIPVAAAPVAASAPVTAPAAVKKERGAFWIQKDGSVTGKYNEEKFVLPQAVLDSMKAQGYADILLKGKQVRVVPNKFKKTALHPDYVSI